VGVEEENNGTYFGITIPGFLKCERQGSLPGCLYEFDHPNRQCAQGRKGEGEREGGCVGFSNGTLHVAISLHCQVPSAVSVRKTMV